MQLIKRNSDNNYEMTEEQYVEIQEAMCNISALLDIMHDYCHHNAENVKICPLITMVEHLILEKKKITGVKGVQPLLR